jgi:methyl-accepting chemotaxis protein
MLDQLFEFIKYVLQGWQVTVTAPKIIVGIIVIILIIWYAMRWRYMGIIEKLKESKNADVATLEARLALAKDQLGPLNSENNNLKEEIATLQSQLMAKASPEQINNTILNVNSSVVIIAQRIEQLTKNLTGETGKYGMTRNPATLTVHRADGTEESR